MADELNVDSLIHRLLEGKDSFYCIYKCIIIISGSKISNVTNGFTLIRFLVA